MKFDLQYLSDLIANEEAEGLYLEFKGGDSLGGDSKQRSELIKDLSGFANGAGGVIVYGIAEEDRNGRAVAATFKPVTTNKNWKDWISTVVRSNTSPPLSTFDITEIPIPSGGFAVVIEISQSSTAHQNLMDHKYYQRAGAVTMPMVDFQVRDVMNRRIKPEVSVSLATNTVTVAADKHRYELEIRIENTGHVTLDHWVIEVDLPVGLQDTRGFFSSHPSIGRMTRTHRRGGKQYLQVYMGDPTWNGTRKLLHPGQTFQLTEQPADYYAVILEVDQQRLEVLQRDGGDIAWRLYVPNGKAMTGNFPLSSWCRLKPHISTPGTP